MTRRLLAAAVTALLTGCGGASRATSPTPTASPTATAVAERVESLPELAPYEPLAVEPYVNGKRLAGRAAQAAATYSTAASVRGVRSDLAVPGTRSAAEVVYAQLSGVTRSSLGVMVVVRQHLQDRSSGVRRTVTRTIDVRLRRSSGAWRLARIASVGGRPVRRPDRVSGAARRVLGHRRIFVPDSARWDIYRGDVDDALLGRLADTGDRVSLSVSVLRRGHPANVWETDRGSAHRRGLAADIYAVGGRLVVRQRAAGSSAHAVAQAFVAGGAAQTGSPWVFAPGGRRSFTDAVRRDHLHLQQRASG